MKNLNYWEKNYNECLFACWKVMSKMQFTLRDLYSLNDNRKNTAFTFYAKLRTITNKWPREYRANLFRFCNLPHIKQEIVIVKLLKL